MKWMMCGFGALILFVLLCLFALVARNYRATPFSVAQDYRYRFGADVREQVLVVASDGHVVWPELDVPLPHLLKLDLRGFWWAVSGVRVRLYLNEVLCSEQAFEMWARGARYLSVPDALRRTARPGDRVRIEVMGGELASSEVELFSRPERELHANKTLVLSPHPDDGEIAAFGLYGPTTSVVTITAGEKGEPWMKGLEPDWPRQYRLKGQVRMWDSLAVPMLAGVKPEHIYSLGYFNGTLRAMAHASEDSLRSIETKLGDTRLFRGMNHAPLPAHDGRNTWGNLVADLAWLLERERPDVIVSPHPFFDSHPDHAFTTVALAQALQRLPPGAVPDILLYTNHAVHSEVFPYGASGSDLALPPWFDAGVPAGHPVFIPLTRDQQVMKAVALESMHDLRLVDFCEASGDAGLWRALSQPLRRWLGNVGGYGASYFRRGVRSSELFFHYDAKGFSELMAGFCVPDRSCEP